MKNVQWVFFITGYLIVCKELEILNDKTDIFVSSFSIVSSSLHCTKKVSTSPVQRIQSLFSSQTKMSEADLLERAETFVSTLMNAAEIDIPNSNGMKVLCNIPSLNISAGVKDIVIRNITDDFWSECINQVNEQ